MEVACREQATALPVQELTTKIIELAVLNDYSDGCTLRMECLEDAYHEVCSVFTKLCPRLVPSPLWSISLARLARVDPEVICGVAYGNSNNDYVAIINEFREWWFSLPRDQCKVCGSQASEVDEDWRYCIEDDTGIAVLERLVPLCEKCHLAKHLGYATIHGKGREALEHLAHINGVDIEVAKRAARRAFKVHTALSRIEKWRTVLKGLTELPKDVMEVIENILNFMASNGYSFDGHWFWYHARRERKELLERKALEESEEFLRRALGIHDKPLNEVVNAVRKDSLVRLAVVRELEEMLGRYGIKVLQRETEIALRGVKVINTTSKPGKSRQILSIFTTSGKWIVFVPSKLRGIVLRRVIDKLRKRDLDYIAKTVGVEESDRDEQPVIIYVPSFLAVTIVGGVAEIMLEAIDEFKIDKLVMFKPDTFTYAGIYSNTVRGMKSYIYMTSQRLRPSAIAS